MVGSSGTLLVEYEPLACAAKSGVVLALELGVPVATPGQQIVSVFVEEAMFCAELVLHSSTFVSELKCTTLSLLKIPLGFSLDAKDWHLMHQTWCGEAGMPISRRMVAWPMQAFHVDYPCCCGMADSYPVADWVLERLLVLMTYQCRHESV